MLYVSIHVHLCFFLQDFPEKSWEPKVQLPYKAEPGQVPRKIEIERLVSSFFLLIYFHVIWCRLYFLQSCRLTLYTYFSFYVHSSSLLYVAHCLISYKISNFSLEKLGYGKGLMQGIEMCNKGMCFEIANTSH